MRETVAMTGHHGIIVLAVVLEAPLLAVSVAITGLELYRAGREGLETQLPARLHYMAILQVYIRLEFSFL